MTLILTQCMKCKHRIKGFRCKAFPNRIPSNVFQENIRHNHILPNQVGDTIYEVQEKFRLLDQRQKENDNKLLSQKKQLMKNLNILLYNIVTDKTKMVRWEKAIIKIKFHQSQIDEIIWGYFKEANKFIPFEGFLSIENEIKIQTFHYLCFLEDNYKSNFIEFIIFPNGEIKINLPRNFKDWNQFN